MKDNLTSGTYNVALTPADTKVSASNVDFTAVSATKAVSIGFPNEVFVISDTTYEKGYTFVKGYNQFDEPITLGGLTITAAPSDSTSYDSSTGKITITSNTDSMYAIAKTVSVFVSYTGEDGKPLTANANLAVSSIGYPSAVTFSAIKKDGTKRPDGKLTIAELGSSKYYVPLTSVQDQYGNEMSADDLNKLVQDNLLTVIPSKGTKSMYFGVGNTVFTTVDGKPAIYLNSGNNMPGTSNLTLTGAGGTFDFPITIEDNPFIQTLQVDVPDVYEGATTDEFTFSAVDQYGNTIDLYDFVPTQAAGKLTFTDMNHLGNLRTSVQASDAGTWNITKDTEKKVVKITYTPKATAKQVITFTGITAGSVSSTQTVTVGTKGIPATVIVPSGSTQLDPTDTTYNFAEDISFKDVNGKVMARTDCDSTYPTFLDASATALTTRASKANETYSGYYWTVTSSKVSETATAAAGAYVGDSDGVIGVNNVSTAQANGALVVGEKMPTQSFYVTLLEQATSDAQYVVLSSQSYRVTYAPTDTTTVKYSVKDTSKMLLYAKEGSKDTEEIEVLASNDSGESWKPDQSKKTLTTEAPFTASGAVVSGDIATDFDDNTTGTTKVKVYYNGDPVDTVSIAYSNKTPVATSTYAKREVSSVLGTSRVKTGYKVDDASTEFSVGYSAGVNPSVQRMTDGEFEITNINNFGDRYFCGIKDQYDVTMTDSIAKLNGSAITDKAGAITTADKKGNFVITNGSQKIDIVVKTEDGGSVTTNKATGTSVASSNYNASSKSQYDAYVALASASNPVTITMTQDITITAVDTFTVPAYVTLVVPAGKTLDVAHATNKTDLTVARYGTLEVKGSLLTGGGGKGDASVDGDVKLSGTWTHTGTGNFTSTGATGTITGSGHLTINGAVTTGGYAGLINLTGDSLEIGATGAINFTNVKSIKGHIIVKPSGSLTLSGSDTTVGGTLEIGGTLVTNGGGVTLENDTYIKTETSAVLTNATRLKIAQGSAVRVEALNGQVVEVTAKSAVSDAVISASDISSATSGVLDEETIVKPNYIVGFGSVTGTTAADIKEKLIALRKEKLGTDTDPGTPDAGITFYAFIAGEKQGGLSGSGKYTVSLTASGLTGNDYTGETVVDLMGQSGTNGVYNYDSSHDDDGLMLIFTKTFNGDLKENVKEGTVITLKVFEGENVTSDDKLVDSCTYTVTAADVAAMN